MIIAENRVIVPGKKFKTKVSCVSTRRLTTIEWLLLSCTDKFSRQESSNYKVKDVFEDVFQFQNSELLIKPCLKSLADLKVIIVKDGNAYTYSALMFSEIVLTELGQVMLKDGLLPGEQREIPLELYYNPLTGKILTVDWQSGDKDEGLEFGTESDYELEFPEKRIVDGLQSGTVAAGKFTAAKYRIESIENLVESEWTAYTDISVDLGDNGELTTIPDILEESVYSRVRDLLSSKDISDKMQGALTPLEEIQLDSIKGSGTNIRQAVQDICKNSKVILIHTDLYDAYKRNTTYFKNKIVVIFGSGKDFEIEIKKEKKDCTRFIRIKDEFPIKGVLLMNEKEESLSICRAKWSFKEIAIQAPIAVVDRQMIPKNRMVANWIENLLIENLNLKPSYLVFASLPGVKVSNKHIKKMLEDMWMDKTLAEIIGEVKAISGICNQLDLMMIDLSALATLVEEKIEYEDIDTRLQLMSEIMDVGLLSKQTNTYKSIVHNIIKEKDKPHNYIELIEFTQKLGINSYEEVVALSGVEEEIYSIEVIEDLIKAIVKGDVMHLPRCFSWDIFFNEYIDCIRFIEAHIAGLNLFESAKIEDLHRAIEICPNIGSLQMYVSEFDDKNTFLMNQSINVYSIMKREDCQKADAFYDNLNCIKDILNKIIDSEYRTTKPRTKKKVYVLDTCALIHNPKILLYFADDEYVRIPTKVIDEIGKIKDRRSDKYDADTSTVARILARNINEEYLGLFNAKNKIRLLIENADTSLLPADLDPTVPDNQILSVALKYVDCETTIISDDNAFLLTSLSQQIKTMTGEEFLEDHKEFAKSLEKWKSSVKNKLPVLRPESEKESYVSESESDRQVSGSIDDLPIRELMHYASELTNPIMSFLNTNSIKTVGQFRQLTPESVDYFKAKGTQMVYKNTIKHVLLRIDQIVEKMNSETK